jgi:hypothetical protein
LAPPVVQELARYYRKSEELERLYNVTQGQVQLAQDRILELQRRYFAVCREMAVAAGGAATISDDDARKTAEALLARSDAASRDAGAGSGNTSGPATGVVATGEGTDPTKKKRRRRRRKKAPGEAGAATAAAGAGEGHDDGHDDAGPDDLDDHDDVDDDGPDEAAIASAPTEGTPTSNVGV